MRFSLSFRSGGRVVSRCWWTCWIIGWRRCTGAPAELWGTSSMGKLTMTTRLPWRTVEESQLWCVCWGKPRTWTSGSWLQVRHGLWSSTYSWSLVKSILVRERSRWKSDMAMALMRLDHKMTLWMLSYLVDALISYFLERYSLFNI